MIVKSKCCLRLSLLLKNNIVEFYDDREGHNKLSKRFGVHVAYVRLVIYQLKGFGMTASQSRIGRPQRISASASKHLIWLFQANHAEMPAVLQGFLVSVLINMHRSIVRRNLNNCVLHGRMRRQKPLLTKSTNNFDLTRTRPILII